MPCLIQQEQDTISRHHSAFSPRTASLCPQCALTQPTPHHPASPSLATHLHLHLTPAPPPGFQHPSCGNKTALLSTVCMPQAHVHLPLSVSICLYATDPMSICANPVLHFINSYLYIYIYVCVYIYIRTHTHTSVLHFPFHQLCFLQFI